jgi:hypothetical protein
MWTGDEWRNMVFSLFSKKFVFHVSILVTPINERKDRVTVV